MTASVPEVAEVAPMSEWLPHIDAATAVVFGFVSIVIAFLSYRAGVRSHDSKMRVEAMSLAESTRSILEEVTDERVRIYEWFRASYAARGNLHSGAMEVKRREFDGFEAKIEKLKSELATAANGIDWLSARKLERKLVEVRSIYEAASGVKEKLAQYHRELREDSAEHRAQVYAALRK